MRRRSRREVTLALDHMATNGPMEAPPRLHELEAEVMEEVWRHESSTVSDVRDALNATADSPRAYTTYMTVMRRLHAKGLLDRRRHGRFDVYTPRLTREQYQEARAQAEVAQLVAHYGEKALAHFARELESLDPDRRRMLRRIARRA